MYLCLKLKADYYRSFTTMSGRHSEKVFSAGDIFHSYTPRYSKKDQLDPDTLVTGTLNLDANRKIAESFKLFDVVSFEEDHPSESYLDLGMELGS